MPNKQAIVWCRALSSTSKHVKQKEENCEPNKPGEEKQRRALRRIAAQFVPHWLKTEPFCFERTSQASNLSMSAERFRTGESFLANAMSDLPGEYRKAYNDSITSFCDELKSAEKLPPNVASALDRLVDAGFGDLEFAKNYKSFKANQLQYARNYALMLQKQKQHTERKKTMEKIRGQVEVLEKELKPLLVQQEGYRRDNRIGKDYDKRKNTIVSTDIESESYMLGLITSAARIAASDKSANYNKPDTELVRQEEHDRMVLEQQILRLERQIRGRKEHVQSHERGLENTLVSIQTIEKQLEQLKTPLSSESFEETQQVVEEALHVLCGALAEHIQHRHSKLINQYQNLDSKTDLTKPHEWYLQARLDKRKIIYHGGPTNSGKTYTALQRLKTAGRGLYLGPLRLLAAEIYETLNAQGVYCSLITGQERREFPFSTHAAATVEMAANLLDQEFDVVVIDEIQMIEDDERGFAWTRALLGLRCKEIHVCGGIEARALIEKIAGACGDDFELCEYDRFSELIVAPRSLAKRPDQPGAYTFVRPGDCIVAFSRNDIFAIQREIEKETPYKCCIIYGTLPPQTRTTQAKLFNDPHSGYDILVASDAISMGLNLNIRRIVFNSIYKNDGNGIVKLGHSAVKQIAGRAGRRNSPYPEGEVTCRDPRDLEYIQQCLSTEINPIEKAGLVPSSSHIELFGEALQDYYYGSNDKDAETSVEPKTPHLHRLLKEFSDMAVVKGNFFLCRQSSMEIIARWLKDVEIETKDKYAFCLAPISTNNQYSKDVLVKFGQKLSSGDVPGLRRASVMKRAKDFRDLARLCSLYAEVELFIWLQNKFPPINLMEQQAALSRKDTIATLINLGLDEAEKLRLDHSYIKRDMYLRATWSNEADDDGLTTDDDCRSGVEGETEVIADEISLRKLQIY